MYIYQTTQRFATVKDEKGNDVESPIAKAYREFLACNDAKGDGTTSTAYFEYNGDIAALKDEILIFFNEWSKKTGIEVKFDNDDVISITCYEPCEYTRVVCRQRLINGELEDFPKEIEDLFISLMYRAINNLIDRIGD